MAGGGDGRGEEGADEIRVVVDGLKSHGAMCKVVVRQRGGAGGVRGKRGNKGLEERARG